MPPCGNSRDQRSQFITSQSDNSRRRRRQFMRSTIAIHVATRQFTTASPSIHAINDRNSRRNATIHDGVAVNSCDQRSQFTSQRDNSRRRRRQFMRSTIAIHHVATRQFTTATGEGVTERRMRCSLGHIPRRPPNARTQCRLAAIHAINDRNSRRKATFVPSLPLEGKVSRSDG